MDFDDDHINLEISHTSSKQDDDKEYNSSATNEKLVIQSLDDYLFDNQLNVIPPPSIEEFPKLFKIRLGVEHEDDMDSKIMALKSSPGISLYTNLLVASFYESAKRKK